MIASVTPRRRPVSLRHQEAFLQMLPRIERQASVAFRDRPVEQREELVTEVIANAFTAFVRLVQRGKADLAYSSVLALFAIRQVTEGRRVGGRLNKHDISSPYARRAHGLKLERLDRYDPDAGTWREALVEDRRAGPAETAAGRIDVAAWLKALPTRSRRIAETLATGEAPSQAARLFGVTPGRMSQMRRELKESWEAFQGGTAR